MLSCRSTSIYRPMTNNYFAFVIYIQHHSGMSHLNQMRIDETALRTFYQIAEEKEKYKGSLIKLWDM